MLRRPPGTAPLAALLAASLLAVPAWLGACTIPVFRYGLDRWPSDPFVLQAPVAAMAREPMASDFAGKDGVRLNLEGQPPAAGAPAEPEARLLFPPHSAEGQELWSGPLTPENFRLLTDSPARAEIGKRIVEGDSGVWVLVESGNAEADEAMAKQLTARMAELEKTEKLPVIDPNDPSSQLAPGPELKIKFSLLRIPRKAPGEQVFLHMLAGPNGFGELPESKPFASLLFGRGRVLGVWNPEKLSDELIDEASRFLLGACSCEAKHLNPGWDVLMRFNWDAELEKVAQRRIAAGELPASAAAAAPVMPERVTYTPASAAPAPAPSITVSAKVPNRLILGGLAAVIGLLALLGLALRKSK